MDEISELLTEDDLSNPFEFYFNNYLDKISSPEKSLMTNVLVYGVIDYIGQDKRLFKDAECWFFGEIEEEWPYSFQNICFTLKIDANNFLDLLKELKKDKNCKSKITKLKHLNPSTGNRNKISAKSIKGDI